MSTLKSNILKSASTAAMNFAKASPKTMSWNYIFEPKMPAKLVEMNKVSK